MQRKILRENKICNIEQNKKKFPFKYENNKKSKIIIIKENKNDIINKESINITNKIEKIEEKRKNFIQHKSKDKIKQRASRDNGNPLP